MLTITLFNLKAPIVNFYRKEYQGCIFRTQKNEHLSQIDQLQFYTLPLLQILFVAFRPAPQRCNTEERVPQSRLELIPDLCLVLSAAFPVPQLSAF